MEVTKNHYMYLKIHSMHTLPTYYGPLCLTSTDSLYFGSIMWPIVLVFDVLMWLGLFRSMSWWWGGAGTVGINFIGWYPDIKRLQLCSLPFDLFIVKFWLYQVELLGAVDCVLKFWSFPPIIGWTIDWFFYWWGA